MAATERFVVSVNERNFIREGRPAAVKKLEEIGPFSPWQRAQVAEFLDGKRNTIWFISVGPNFGYITPITEG